MAENRDLDVLNDLTTIIQGVSESYLDPLFAQQYGEQKHAALKEAAEKATEESDTRIIVPELPNSYRRFVSKSSLELAIEDVKGLLHVEAKNSPPYVRDALSKYLTFLEEIFAIDDSNSKKYILDAAALAGLNSFCADAAREKLLETMPNICRPRIYSARSCVSTLETMREEAHVEESFAGKAIGKDAIGHFANAGKAYLSMCKSCPFAEYNKLENVRPKRSGKKKTE